MTSAHGSTTPEQACIHWCYLFNRNSQDLLRKAALGANQEKRLETVNTLLKEFNRANHHNTTVPPLHIANLTQDDWAELHGPLYKSAICRHAATFSLQLAEQFYTEPDAYSEGVLQANRSLCRIYDVLYASGVFLNHAQLADLTDAVLNLGAAFHMPRSICQERGDLY